MHPSDQSSFPSSGGMPFGWYAAYTRHQHEKSTAQLLTRKGFEVLLPLYRSRSRWTDRTQVVLLPLFPNYLFVRCDLHTRLQVLQTAGVCWFVSNAGVPALLSQTEIEMVRRITESPMNAQPHCYLECGNQVRVLRGPLAGFTGSLARVKNQFRVIISLELLRKSAAVEIDLCDLERVRPSASVKAATDAGTDSWKFDGVGRTVNDFGRKAYRSELSYGK